MATAPKGKATKAASWEKAYATLPSSILKEKSWDEYGQAELLRKMMDSLAYFTGKTVSLSFLGGVKGDLVCGNSTLTKKDHSKLVAMLKAEYAKVAPIVMLNSIVLEATYKTPMGLCWVDPALREFFLGDKAHAAVDLGSVYAMNYSEMEQLITEKIGLRRRKLMKERYAKSGLPDAKERALATFVPPFEIPKSSESSSHIFTKLNKPVLDAVALAGGWSTHATISALLSLYFRSYELNIKMTRPRAKTGDADAAVARETPKVKFDDRMADFFGSALLEEDGETDADGKRRKKAARQGRLFSDADMSAKGIGYLQAIQRILSRFTKKRKNLEGAMLAAYDKCEANVEEMTRIHDATKAAVETKRYYKEMAELEKRSAGKQ